MILSTDGQTDRRTDGRTERQTGQTYRQTGNQTNTQTDRHTGRTDGQTDGQTDRRFGADSPTRADFTFCAHVIIHDTNKFFKNTSAPWLYSG